MNNQVDAILLGPLRSAFYPQVISNSFSNDFPNRPPYPLSLSSQVRDARKITQSDEHYKREQYEAWDLLVKDKHKLYFMKEISEPFCTEITAKEGRQATSKSYASLNLIHRLPWRSNSNAIPTL